MFYHIPVLRDENSESFIKLYLSFYELLGSEASDLLDEHRGKVDIMEDKFGKINAKNATEIEITSPTQFKSLIEGALSHRQTATTFKNDTSSRSHAICAIRVENVRLREVEDGKIFVITKIRLAVIDTVINHRHVFLFPGY